MSHAPLTDDTTADRASRRRRMSPGATAVTAAIAAGSLALATYAATAGPGTTQDSTESLRASVGQFSPTVAADAVAALSTTAATESNGLFAQLREMREEQARDAMGASASILDESVSTLRQQSEVISEQMAAERAAEAAAEREAAEAAAAEQERRAAEAAAEQERQAAAEQEAAAAQRAEQEAAARASSETTASRSAAREPAPAAAPAPAAPEPAPAPAPVSSGNPRSIAQSMLGSYGWGQDQFGCLDSLWQKESNWDAGATNPSSGAYGIPQSLPASKMASAGADWQTNPATQISWGLTYISDRYGSPCSAWAHSQANNWY